MHNSRPEQCSKMLPRRRTLNLLNHLVGAGEQGWRDFKTERIGGSEIEEEFDFCDLLYRQISPASRRRGHDQRRRQRGDTIH